MRTHTHIIPRNTQRHKQTHTNEHTHQRTNAHTPCIQTQIQNYDRELRRSLAQGRVDQCQCSRQAGGTAGELL